jgi:hypothetical protein
MTKSKIYDDIVKNKKIIILNGFYLYRENLYTDYNIVSYIEARRVINSIYKTNDTKLVNDIISCIITENSFLDNDFGLERFKLRTTDLRKNFLEAKYFNCIKNPIDLECKVLKTFEFIYPEIPFRDILYDIIFSKTELIYIFQSDIAGTGKSTLLELISLIYYPFCTYMTVNQMSDKFNLSNIAGKFLVIGDDLGSESFGDNVGLIKSIASNNLISVEQKYLPNMTIRNIAKLIFASNKEIVIDKSDDGLWRRISYVNFDTKILNSDENFREECITKKESSKLYWILKSHNFIKDRILEYKKQAEKKMMKKNIMFHDDVKSYDDYKTKCDLECIRKSSKRKYLELLEIVARRRIFDSYEVDNEDYKQILSKIRDNEKTYRI